MGWAGECGASFRCTKEEYAEKPERGQEETAQKMGLSPLKKVSVTFFNRCGGKTPSYNLLCMKMLTAGDTNERYINRSK